MYVEHVRLYYKYVEHVKTYKLASRPMKVDFAWLVLILMQAGYMNSIKVQSQAGS